jgi:hypothetical protein
MANFEIVSSNMSNYSPELVWENAQDMEHVGTLHSNTNEAFRIINLSRLKNSEFLYEQLSYSATRKLMGFLPMNTFGYRKILKKFHLLQVEYNPLLNMKTQLISTIEPHKDDPKKSWMIDYVTVSVPFFLLPAKKIIISALKNHAKTQCLEDEEFRQRRLELLDRKIHLPLSIFDETLMDEIELHVNKDFDVKRKRVIRELGI